MFLEPSTCDESNKKLNQGSKSCLQWNKNKNKKLHLMSNFSLILYKTSQIVMTERHQKGAVDTMKKIQSIANIVQ